MDNRELIERAKEVRAFSEHGSLAGKLADALERAEAELADLREVISQTASAIGNGAGIDKASSLQFIKGLPTEVRLHCTRLRADAYQADEECKAAQAELAKYRSAPVVAIFRPGRINGSIRQMVRLTEGKELELIIRPEAS